MKQKLLTLFTLLLTVCSGAWGTDVTVGRSVAFNKSATDFSLTNVTNTTCTKADGTGDKSSNNTQEVFHNGSSVNMKGNLCYVNKIGGTNVNNSSNFNENLYCGFNLSIADGYELTVTNLTTKIATSANVFYNIKVIDLDKGNAVLYGGETSNITVTNYSNKSTYTNFDHTFTPASELVLSGNVQVRLYWNQNSTAKYICPLEIFINGSLESISDSRVDPDLSYGTSIVNKVIGDAAFINTLTNENGVTITYSISNNGTGSTINENTGEVTIGNNQGTETITATSTATSTYKSGNATYTLNVGMSAVSNKFWDFSTWETGSFTSVKASDNIELVATSDKNMEISSNNNAQEVGDKSFTKRLKLNGAGNASYRYVHFKVAPGSKISVYQYSGNSERKLKVYAGSFDETKLLEEGTTEYKKSTCIYKGDVATDIYVYSGNSNISIYGIKVEPTEKVTITDAGYATFSSTEKLDFTDVEGLTAYKATATGENSVTLKDVTGVVPAETGLLLKGAKATYYIPVSTAAATAVTSNLLRSTAKSEYTVTGSEEGTAYVFGSLNDVVGFYKAAVGKKIGVGKSWLLVPPPSTPINNANFLSFVFGDEEQGETDGIKAVSTNVENGVRYNLAGQKVGADYKGIVIVNGKKVIIK